MELKKMIRLSMLLSLSVVLSFLESLFPVFNGFMIPGVKIGFANIVLLCILYLYGFKEAFLTSILRVLLVSLLRTGLFNINFYFSIAGAISSMIFMNLAKKYMTFSVLGVSVVGSVVHSITQVMVATCLLETSILYYLPWIFLLAIPTGILTGIISKELMKTLEKNDF